MFKLNKNRIIAFSCFIILIFSISLYLGYETIMPTSLPKDYEEKIITLDDVKNSEPSFNMTLSHLNNMSKKPHPVGSEEQNEVRTYLTNQITKLGCTYTEEDFVTEGVDNKNYLVKIDAPNTDTGTLFVSHYDSAENGPGAADDLISVSSMLEALRSVKDNGNLTNDMYFLFTDGEEVELNGSTYFVNTHPEMKEKIKLVVNLEARGTNGTLLMFETSDNNKEVIKMLNKSVSNLTAYSFMKTIYRTMPNNTDLSVFLDNGYKGINFAALGGGENYHMESDNYTTLDRKTAYMYHKTSIELVNYLSTSNINKLDSQEDAMYFSFFKGNTIAISNSVFFLLEIIVCVCALIWLSFVLIKKKCRIKDIIKVLLTATLSIPISMAFSFIEKKIAGLFLEGGTLLELIHWLDFMLILLVVVVILGVTLVIFRSAKLVQTPQGLILGVFPLFFVITIVLLFTFQSAAYLTSIPLFLLLICSISIYFTERLKKLRILSLIIGTIVITITSATLFVPIIITLYQAFFIKIFFAYAGLTALAVSACIALAGGLYKEIS